MNCLEKAQRILLETTSKHAMPIPHVYTVDPLLLPSCGLMGDDRVYGYAWVITGDWNYDDPRTYPFLHDISIRLTNEVVHEDGTRFVRVFAEIPMDTKGIVNGTR